MRYTLALTDDKGTVIASWTLESDPTRYDPDEDADDLQAPGDFGAEVEREVRVFEDRTRQQRG